MVPVGVERDKRIAELRGLGKCDRWPCVDHEWCPDYKIQCAVFIKPYSTDIATAMELWGEMSNDTNFEKDKWHLGTEYKDGNYRAILISYPFNIRYFSVFSSSLPQAIADAISGAYLKWKELE